MILRGRRGGRDLAVYVELEYKFCGRQYLFSSNFSKDHLFKDIAYLNLMDACMIIFLIFLGTKIYFKGFYHQDIFFKKLPAPPPPFRINFSTPKIKGPDSTIPPIVPTAILNTKPCSTGYGLVRFIRDRGKHYVFNLI